MNVHVFLLLTLSTANTTPLSSKEPSAKPSPTQLSNVNKCAHGSIAYSDCNDECECHQGELVNCSRVRREFTTMSFADRRRYIEVYKRASSDPLFVDEYTNLVGCHIIMPQRVLHLTPNIFLPWHRWYLVQWENFLRKIDCRITLPFWDFSQMATNWWRKTDPTDFWNAGDHGLGGSGVPPENCVEDGPFRKDLWNLTEKAGGGCLKRKFNHSVTLPNRKVLLHLLSHPVSEFLKFEKFLRFDAHLTPHDAIMGSMSHTTTTSNAPEFIILHSFMDKIWTTWQNKGEDYKFAFFKKSKFKLPFSSTYEWQWLDNNNLPGGIRIRYEDERDGIQNAM